MKKAEWIWIDHQQPDVHAEFIGSFVTNSKRLRLKISCDGNYVVFVNGKYVGLGQMSDYEEFKMLDEYALSDVLVKGENTLRIVVWHIGVGSVNYRSETAGLFFEVYDGEDLISCSGPQIQSRIVNGFTPSYRKFIAQVGITFQYDFNKTESAFSDSILAEKKVEFANTNVPNLKLMPEVTGNVLVRESNRVLVDLGREYFGFVKFSLASEEANNKFTTFFGEHLLENGEVLRKIAYCHFGLDFVAKQGRNEFQDYLRPVGCRYLEIVSEKEIEVERLSIVPLEYPFKKQGLTLQDPTDQRIYDACVHTLKCCASKHYMDCPWREQGMYVLDSRNQMLCGYYAFGEYQLPRFNLIMLSKGMTKFGLLCSCPPSSQDNFIIPFFSLIYVLQVYEYVTYSKDTGILSEVEETLRTIMQTFVDRIDERGLITRFPWENFWNFYEWTEGSDGWPCDEEASRARKDDQTYDLILNCAFVMAMEKYGQMQKMLHKECFFPLDEYRKAIKEEFFDEEKKVFRLYSGADKYSRLGCSFALLAEIVTGKTAEEVADRMLHTEDIIDCSLACAGYFYDALLCAGEKYRPFILNDIREKYTYMLRQGATTFWETIQGSRENGGIGSLCHGWSAMPVYYFHKFSDLHKAQRKGKK